MYQSLSPVNDKMNFMNATQPDLLLNETTDGDVGVALNLSLEALGAEEQRIRWDGSQAMGAI